PSMKRGSIEDATLAKSATASVGATKNEVIPVSASILSIVNNEAIPVSIDCHIPANLKIPIKINTTTTAGIITKKTTLVHSFADEKIVFKNDVLGVKRGSS